MSKLPAGFCADKAVSLDGIHNAMTLLMGELYEHMAEGHDAPPTHNDCAAWGDGLAWLARSVARVRDDLREAQS